MCSRLTEEQKEIILPSSERASKSEKEFWYAKRNYCLETCKGCKDVDLFKKIYWELQKLNTLLESKK